MAGYHVENFGCRASHADGDAIAAELDRAGASEAAAGFREADCVVLNTCSVTAEAEKTSRAYLRRVRRENPEARVVVTGCYAQRAPAEVAALPGVTRVIGNSHKALVPLAVHTLLGLTMQPLRSGLAPEPAAAPVSVPISQLLRSGSNAILADPLFAHADLAAPDLISSGDTRPNLKVQDGCGNRCSFCIIPTTRGHSRSLGPSEALDRVNRFADAGGKELVLSGINLGRWGRDLQPAARFEDLVEAILVRTDLPRLRISSVEPMDWTPALLSLFREFAHCDSPAGTAELGGRSGPRLARHAHLPLQSGADATLRAMHRRYRPWHYEEKLAAIRAAVPGAAIGADVMVGFPGETDALFAESFCFIARQPFTYLHLFPFSPRPGTPGFALHREKPVPAVTVEERLGRLRRLIAEKNLAFRQSFVGNSLPVVTLKPSPDDQRRGVTPAISDNFIKVEIGVTRPANQMLTAHISSITSAGLIVRQIR